MESSKSSTEQSPTEPTMDRMQTLVNSTTGMRSMNNPVSVYLANEINPQPAMSDLNMFRPNGGPLPLWNNSSQGGQAMNYSLLSSKPMTTTTPVMDSDTVSHNGHSKGGTGGSYDMFNSNGHEDTNSFQFSPSASMEPNSNQESASSSSEEDPADDHFKSTDHPSAKRKPRMAVPEERKDDKYWARRRKNNDAAKKSREMRRKKLELELKTAKGAISENVKLKQEIDLLKSEINSLRRLLKDANTTLSLWIRARQASEPNVQLPPMLRGSNVSFVNFPVTTAT